MTTLRELREASGLSLRHVADRMGVSFGYLSAVERGRAPALTAERCRQVAEVLGVDPVVVLEVAAQERGEWRIPLPSSPLAAAVLSGLAALAADAGDGEVRGMLEGVLRG